MGPKKQEKRNQIISESIIEKILEDIKQGRIKPGDRLDSQRKLAKKYNVGMSSIREAISALSILNIVSARHGKGVFVSKTNHDAITYPLKIKPPISKKEVINFYKVRKYLDLGAVADIINHATDEQLELLDEVLDCLDSLLDKVKKGNSIKEYVDKDIELHHTIYRMTGNAVLISLVEFLNNNLVGNLGVYFSNIEETMKAHKIHQKIVESIKQRNLDEAKYYSALHIEKTIKALNKLLKD